MNSTALFPVPAKLTFPLLSIPAANNSDTHPDACARHTFSRRYSSQGADTEKPNTRTLNVLFLLLFFFFFLDQS